MVKTFLAIIGLALTSLLATPAWAGSFDGVWVGEYVCRQGKTALALTIGAGPSGKPGAIFQFSAHPKNPKVPAGSFFADAKIDAKAGSIALKPYKWLDQPDRRYKMVALEGKLSGKNVIKGKLLKAPGCTTFTVYRNGKGSRLRWSKGIDGIWTGHYTCAQGKTALAMTITGGKKGVFQFAPYRGNSKTPIGLYATRIKTDGKGAIKIDPAAWKLRPSGYRKVGLEGKLKGKNRMTGKVTWLDGCTSFQLSR